MDQMKLMVKNAENEILKAEREIKIAKVVFQELAESGGDPEAIVKEKGLVQVSDEGAVVRVVEDVFARSERQIEEYCSGKDKVFGYFVGQVMKESKGKFNPAVVNKILREKLDERRAANP